MEFRRVLFRSLICKKSNKSTVINWKNDEKKITFLNVPYDIFLSEYAITNKKPTKIKNFLPYYIGFLNKKNFLIKLNQNKTNILIKKYDKNYNLTKGIKFFILNEIKKAQYRKNNIIFNNNTINNIDRKRTRLN